MPLRERITSVDELRSWKDEIPFHYEYTAGVAGEKFLRGLKDGRILAGRCPHCGTRYLPPKMYCIDCFVEIKDFEDVGPKGTVSAITSSHSDFEGRKLSEPRAFVFVTFAGVKGGLIHHALGKGAKLGAEATAKFRAKGSRKGTMNDLEGFSF